MPAPPGMTKDGLGFYCGHAPDVSFQRLRLVPTLTPRSNAYASFQRLRLVPTLTPRSNAYASFQRFALECIPGRFASALRKGTAETRTKPRKTNPVPLALALMPLKGGNPRTRLCTINSVFVPDQRFQLLPDTANRPPGRSQDTPDQDGLVTIDTPFPQIRDEPPKKNSRGLRFAPPVWYNSEIPAPRVFRESLPSLVEPNPCFHTMRCHSAKIALFRDSEFRGIRGQRYGGDSRIRKPTTTSW